MFGCCVAGRLLQTNIQQVDDTHCIFNIENASTINHICVFLLGTVPFPAGYAATVHFLWPGRGFQLLGMLSNEKPSAVFRLRGAYTPSQQGSQSTISDAMRENYSSGSVEEVAAVLGIAIEPLDIVEAQIALLSASHPSDATSSTSLAVGRPVPNISDPIVLTERIVKHMFNYLSSFATTPGTTGTEMVQLSVIRSWYDSFMSKVRTGGLGFLEKPAE